VHIYGKIMRKSKHSWQGIYVNCILFEKHFAMKNMSSSSLSIGLSLRTWDNFILSATNIPISANTAE